MNYLNRSAMIVTAKEPYARWANSLDDTGPRFVLDESKEDTVYLIPEFEEDSEKEKILAKYFADIFEYELWGWWTDETAWPDPITLELFKEWFDVRFYSDVVDVSRQALKGEPI